MNNYNSEFEEHSCNIKRYIKNFISYDKLSEANRLINKYEKILKNDINIYSMKAIIAIKECRFDDAEKILTYGMQIDSRNFDLIYNKAYMYELKNNIPFAIKYYNMALEVCNGNLEIKDEITNVLENLNKKLIENINARVTSIVIVTYNKLQYTKLCVDSIRKYIKFGTYEIIIVDNNSTDGTVEWLKRQNDIKTIFNNKNSSFTKSCNQGISIATGDNILLLNNESIIMPNCFENMKIALYSSEDIGGVGAITNFGSNNQAIYVDYEDIDGMVHFAEKNNITDPARWEERIRLIGSCMLIKKHVVDKIGLFDESFTLGNFADDDYSYRIRQARYKLVLCKDSFIHRFEIDPPTGTNDYNMILSMNKEKFKDKWGFDPIYSSFTRYEIINFIKEPIIKDIKVLEVGCACGATLLEIRNRYKYAELHGIELNKNTANIGSIIAEVKAENIESKQLSYEENYFDYIIFADVLEHLYNPWEVLKNIKKYLKQDGKILASIPNVMHYSVVRNLLNGRWKYEDAGILDRTHVRFFTLNEIINMFVDSGYVLNEIASKTIQSSKSDKDFVDSLVTISSQQVENQFNTYQYIIKASNQIEQIDKKQKQEDNIKKVPLNVSNTRKKFVTLFVNTINNHLTKDVGMIPYLMYKDFNYDSKIVCYKSGEYPYLNKEVKGLKIEFIENSGNVNSDMEKYLMKNSEGIDILHLFHLSEITLRCIQIYKSLNPHGKIYLKLDANINITGLKVGEDILNILRMCTLISVETKYLYKYLNENWNLKVEYIPNGFYDFVDAVPVKYSEKENIICTVGRIGLPVKANEILLEAFKIAAPKLLNWKMKIIGPITDEFKPFILRYFNESPELKNRVIFTGEILDKQKLENEYRKTKIFCLTSRNESFGIVYVEAAKNGCFIISSNILPAWDITDNKKYGDIFEIDNVKQLSQMITRYAEDDKKLEENCSKIQKFAYSNFQWKGICKNINKFLTNEDSLIDEFEDIKEIIKNGAKNSNSNDRVFIDRLRYNADALKMKFWESHFELDAVKKYAEINGDILDFGCGSGHMDILLAREGRRIHGIDLSNIGINIANYLKKKESSLVKANVEFFIEDVTAVPKSDKLYDSVWACHVFEHIANIQPIIEGLRKRVKVGAYMVASVPLGYAYNDQDHVNHFFNEKELEKFFQNYIEVIRIDLDAKNKVLRALCKFS